MAVLLPTERRGRAVEEGGKSTETESLRQSSAELLTLSEGEMEVVMVHTREGRESSGVALVL